MTEKRIICLRDNTMNTKKLRDNQAKSERDTSENLAKTERN